MYRRWPLAALAVALALITAPAAFGASSDPPAAAAGWHGREIRDPLPQRVRGAVARFPRGWSAGTVGRGSGYRSRDGSRRVREVQRRLLAPRLPARSGRRALRRAHPRRRDLVSDQTRPPAHRPRRRPQHRDHAPDPPARAPTGDAPSPPSAARGGRCARPHHAARAARARRPDVAGAVGGDDHDRPRGDRLVVASRAARPPSGARRRRSRRAARAADGEYAAPGACARRRRRLHRPRARQRPRPRDRLRRADHRGLVRGSPLAAAPKSSTTSSLPADASPTDRDSPTRSTRSPPAASRASCSPTWATSHARSPSSPSCCDG